MLGDTVAEVRSELAGVAADASLTEGERRARLRGLMETLRDSLAEADRQLRDAQRRQEASAASQAADRLFAGSVARLREELVEAGVDPLALDEAGVPDADEVERLREEGLLEGVAAILRKAWEETKHPRGRGGLFKDKFGVPEAPKAPRPRAPEPPKPPHVPTPEPRAPRPPRAPEVQAKSKGAPGLEVRSPLEGRMVAAGAIDEATLAQIRELGLDLPREERRKRSPLADQLLGSAKDTRDLYRDPQTGRYSAERKKLHDQIVDTLLRQRRDGALDSEGAPLGPPADGHKVALFMAGGNASGKSTALKMPGNESVMPQDAAHIDFDEIKQQLPEFKQMAAGHDIYGTDATHFESADIARRVLEEARSRGLNVVIDASGDSTTKHFHDTITGLKRDGYETRVLMVDADFPLAVKSMVERAHANGRYVPIPIMERVHRNSVARHLEWRDSPDVDSWMLYHRDGEGHGLDDFKLVAAGGTPLGVAVGGKSNPEPEPAGKRNFTVYDEAGYAAVLAKAPGGKGTKPDKGRKA